MDGQIWLCSVLVHMSSHLVSSSRNAEEPLVGTEGFGARNWVLGGERGGLRGRATVLGSSLQGAAEVDSWPPASYLASFW
jgi:hypothetical protein